MLSTNPSERLGAKGDWKEVLGHPFFDDLREGKVDIMEGVGRQFESTEPYSIHQSDESSEFDFNFSAIEGN